MYISCFLQFKFFEYNKNKLKDVLTVSHVFNGSYVKNQGIIYRGDIMEEVNDGKVNNVDELREQLKKPITVNNKKYHTFKTEDGSFLAIDLDTVEKENKFISEKYNLQLYFLFYISNNIK